MNRAYLGLGTNMGDRLDYLNKACDLLEQNENIINLKKIFINDNNNIQVAQI